MTSSWPGVQADAGEADLALLLRDALRVEELVGDLGGGLLAVEVPDVHVVGAELLQALVEVGEGLLLRLAARLRGDEDLVAAALEGRADEALVVAALVAARGVEEVHAEVGGALDDALVRGDHAAEGDLGDLQAGLAELALADDGRGGARARAPIAGGAGFGVSIDGVGRGGQREAGERGGGQELATGAGAGHGETPPIWSNRTKCDSSAGATAMDRSASAGGCYDRRPARGEAMGEVYRARDRGSGARWRSRCCRPRWPRDADRLARFEREARTVGRASTTRASSRCSRSRTRTAPGS